MLASLKIITHGMRAIFSGFAILAISSLASLTAIADEGPNLIPNSGFEAPPAATPDYGLFTGPESKDKNCRFIISSDAAHAGKQSALMQADDFARCGLNARPVPVVAGECYRIGAWMKAGADFQVQPGSPGAVIRLNMTAGKPPAPAGGGFIFIYPNNAVSQAGPPNFSPLQITSEIPAQWTHMEAIVKVPAGVDSIGLEYFFWRAKGSLYLDDFTFQKVDPTTQVTPVMGNASAPPAP